MSLKEKKRLFFEIRAKCEIIVRSHAFEHYPERGFSKNELVNLVRIRIGKVTDNNSPEAITDSFLFFVKDDFGRECKIVILLEEVEILDEESGSTKKEMLIICSAYRAIK